MAQDKVTLARIQQAHPSVRAELSTIYTEICEALKGKALCRFAYVLRTFEEQTALYAQGRKTLLEVNALRKTANLPALTATENKKTVTNAPAGLSIHQYGLAVDIVLIVDMDGNGSFETASWDTRKDFDGDGVSDWMEIVAIFKKHNWTWGGDWTSFRDLPHFEKKIGRKASDLLTRYRAGQKDRAGYVTLT